MKLIQGLIITLFSILSVGTLILLVPFFTNWIGYLITSIFIIYVWTHLGLVSLNLLDQKMEERFNKGIKFGLMDSLEIMSEKHHDIMIKDLPILNSEGKKYGTQTIYSVLQKTIYDEINKQKL